MASIDDGGPAFPSTDDKGMSLRDYFAGQALAMGGIYNTTPEEKAAAAYAIADALLAQRATDEGPTP